MTIDQEPISEAGERQRLRQPELVLEWNLSDRVVNEWRNHDFDQDIPRTNPWLIKSEDFLKHSGGAIKVLWERLQQEVATKTIDEQVVLKVGPDKTFRLLVGDRDGRHLLIWQQVMAKEGKLSTRRKTIIGYDEGGRPGDVFMVWEWFDQKGQNPRIVQAEVRRYRGDWNDWSLERLEAQTLVNPKSMPEARGSIGGILVTGTGTPRGCELWEVGEPGAVIQKSGDEMVRYVVGADPIQIILEESGK